MRYTARLSKIKMSYVDTGSDQQLLVLLHGWPQTAQCWERIIPALAKDYRVVAPDLRGYGLSDKPQRGYEKKSMAQDVRELIDALGFAQARIVGHDRGARVGHRFALDYPESITHLTVLDVAPTLHTFRGSSPAVAQKYWHWLFHIAAGPARIAGRRTHRGLPALLLRTLDSSTITPAGLDS